MFVFFNLIMAETDWHFLRLHYGIMAQRKRMKVLTRFIGLMVLSQMIRPNVALMEPDAKVCQQLDYSL